MKTDDMKDFIEGKVDFGKVEPDFPMTEDQRQIAALTMATNCALVQLVLEGSIEPEQQMHFMSHLQDFAERIYGGESITFESNKDQTLQLNSKAGTLFYEAAMEALKNGHKNFKQLSELGRKIAAARNANPDQPDDANKQAFDPTNATAEEIAMYEKLVTKPRLN